MLQEYLVIEVLEVSQKGMIFVRIHLILTAVIKTPIIMACVFLFSLSTFVQCTMGSPKILDFTIYADGTTHVFYQTDVDSQSPESTLNLYGTSIENLVAQDENGTLLESNETENTTTVETLGSSTIKVDYDTQDLVSKNGKTWTFYVNSPIDYSILLPKNSVIVGMNVAPLNIQIADDQSLISLPSGSSEINYIIGVLGTNKTATVAIQHAQDFINTTAASVGGKTPNKAIAKLETAKSDFNQGKYSDAESLANAAKSLALQEQQITNNSVSNISSDNFPTYLLIVVVGIVTAGATGLIIIKRTRSSNTVIPSDIIKNNNYVAADMETIYKLKPELRQDDKDIVAFISEKGGQVFESDLRKKFLMPRTTMWRAVKRLEREDIIEIEKIDQKNLIKLRKIGVDEK